MKVILSRKGFDSSYGGYPSPILPNGRLVSLPIPRDGDAVRYSELKLGEDRTYCSLIRELGIERVTVRDSSIEVDAESTCHLDPDIERRLMERHGNWKPLFGQLGAAQRHLQNQNIGVGDLFLFFGWFRRTEYQNGILRFGLNEPDLHIIFGYMQIGEIIAADLLREYDEWMRYHPHVESTERKLDSTNTLYVGRDRLSFDENLPGASSFNFSQDLVLTKKGLSRSKWDLNPEIFGDTKISYHPNPWKAGYFQSAGRGQEFVIEGSGKVRDWAKNLVSNCASRVNLF